MKKFTIDRFGEKAVRRLASKTSRRSFVARLGAAAAFAPAIPCLPVARAAAADNKEAMSEFARKAQTTDDKKCNYWRYCGIDGALCTCCGGGVHTCPAGTQPSTTSWVGTCRNPDDGRTYLLAYRDCCGTGGCRSNCLCDNTEREMPVYRPQGDNQIIWCFGLEAGMAYHCSTAALVGEA